MDAITKYTSMGLELKKLYCYCLHFGPLLFPKPKSQPVGARAASPFLDSNVAAKLLPHLQDKTRFSY